MRTKFSLEFAELMPNFVYFTPESAMSTIAEDGLRRPMDIAQFEALIGELAHSIVIFPEAPGSFAETGYFALHPNLRSKSLLVLDTQYQGADGFINLGPARRFNDKSAYSPNLFMDYNNPLFSQIRDKILARTSITDRRRPLHLPSRGAIPIYDLFCVISALFSNLGNLAPNDVMTLAKSVTKRSLKKQMVFNVIAIMVGAGRISPLVKDFCFQDRGQSRLVSPRDGYTERTFEALADIANLDFQRPYEPPAIV